MKIYNLFLVIILAVSLFGINAVFAEEELCTLSVKISGTTDYDPHQELVIIRLFNSSDSNGSPILTMTRTDDDDIAHFMLEHGDYWIDVRNVWVRLLLENDTFFEYPYLLYRDAPPWSGNETDQPDDATPLQEYIFMVFVLPSIFAVFVSLLVYRHLKTKKQSKEEKREEQQEKEKEDLEDTEEQNTN